jgi:uncharacterized protein
VTPESHRAELHRGFSPRPFRPALWLPGAHLQTVGGKFLRPHPDPGLESLRIETPDGDFLDLEVGPEPRPGAPVVLVLHGLEGSSRRGYVRVAMVELHRRGLRPVGLNFRSCSGEPNLQPRFYHSGETGDLAHVLEVLADRFPGRPLGALGFSLGGNVLLKYLGEEGDGQDRGSPSLQAAATVSVPFDLSAGARVIEEGFMGKVYTRYFVRSLQEKLRSKEPVLRELLDLEAAMAAATLREYDEVATAPLHGFPDAESYYRASSSLGFLLRIRTPALLLQSGDDPFLPPGSLPIREVEENPFLLGAFTRAGGHVGFVAGARPWRPRFWAEEEAARYLAGALAG